MSDVKILRLSISEASKFFGVSQRTIRRAVKNAEVAYIVVRGRYRVNFESLLKWSQKRPGVRNKLMRDGVGQYVDQWRINNRLYSPNPNMLTESKKENDEGKK